MKVNWVKEKEKLVSLLENKESYEHIGRLYGVSGNAVKKAAKKLGLELEKRRKINKTETFNKGCKKTGNCVNCGKEIVKKNKYCSNKCQCDYEYKIYINRWKNGEINGLVGQYGISSMIRRYLLEKFNNKCQQCDWGEINHFTKKIPLEIHHKDGDYSNNKESNLELLCPNCHSLTETYKNANKNGRKNRNKYF